MPQTTNRAGACKRFPALSVGLTAAAVAASGGAWASGAGAREAAVAGSSLLQVSEEVVELALHRLGDPRSERLLRLFRRALGGRGQDAFELARQFGAQDLDH